MTEYLPIIQNRILPLCELFLPILIIPKRVRSYAGAGDTITTKELSIIPVKHKI